MTLTLPSDPLRTLYEHWANPPANLVGKIPKAGAQLDYLGHAEVTRALIESDPQWTWEPAALNPETGEPLMVTRGEYARMWIKLTVHGVTRYGVGTVKSDKADVEKELIGDALRNAAMRFGVALSLWSKQEWADVGAYSAEPGIQHNTAPNPGPSAAKATERVNEALAQITETFGDDVKVIENFEPVYEDDSPFEEPVASKAPSPAPESDRPQPAGAGTISDPQVRKISVMLSNLGVTDNNDRHEVAGSILARPIGSLKELSKKEASTLIDSLDKLTAADFEESPDGRIGLVGSF